MSLKSLKDIEIGKSRVVVLNQGQFCASSPVTHRGHLEMSRWASQVAQVVKKPPANAGDIRDKGSIPGLGRALEEGNKNPLQYSCLGNHMDRGARQSIVYGVAEESHMTYRLNNNKCLS